ncbi:protein SMAX1-LIKE 4-like isoform X2 [Andrographis paniculata]|uniref:protein SMAX1-LIKE 4-like isoform X2 n=1 Tax=Andrographis paniculata TaxID=175694 RepID=UPI0021E7E7B9|nr:protein SMAX1-LIKE 4-like isoform X2 [Andrographis paniculata]
MRSVAAAAQPTLSPESAAVLKHSLALARRRRHAKLTPLHVAATLLTPAASPLRAACLKSQSPPSPPPHQCRALDLCFNVALNRLHAPPAALHHHAWTPSMSNALIAALKRAQAHRRRGCADHHHHHLPPIAAVELQQLIISVLDDPGVSRVLTAAGFSSAAVKFAVENFSGGFHSSPKSPNNPNFNFSQFPQNPNFIQNPQFPKNSNFKNSILQIFLRNTVIVADTISTAESAVSDLACGDISGDFKLIKFPLSSLQLRFMTKEEVSAAVVDLKRRIETSAASPPCPRVIAYVGNLEWAAVDGSDNGVIGHLIAEIEKLLRWCKYYYSGAGSSKVSLMAAAGYDTYMKCKKRNPPLDLQWNLETLSIPSMGLSILKPKGFVIIPKEEDDSGLLPCCPNYSSTSLFNKEILLHEENRSHRYIPSSYRSRCPNKYKAADTVLTLGTHRECDCDRVEEDIVGTLRESIPWQIESIPSIATALMDGYDRRQDTWMLIRGNDIVGKRKLAVGIAKAVFGSSDFLFRLDPKNNCLFTVFENSAALEMALRSVGKLIVLVENVDSADPGFLRFLADILEGRKRRTWTRVIFILTIYGDGDYDTWCNKFGDDDVESTVISMKLIVCKTKYSNPSLKRKMNRDDAAIRAWKCPRRCDKIDEVEVEKSVGLVLDLDLNVIADDDNIDDNENYSPISSDVMREPTVTGQHSSPLAFLKTIETQIFFNRFDDDRKRAKRALRSKFECACGNKAVFLDVEEAVVDEVFRWSEMWGGGGAVVEEWIEKVLGRSLGMVSEGGNGRSVVRVCLGGKGRQIGIGYKGSCLPKRIPVLLAD